ncbi:hypothetical protein EV200_101227 [Pedobacter psychrotolerans]|uniref:Glycosyl transferase family 2 n=1 Tax=Pedobacter psychrotolerans TaxID=1843235 RepID=A0A4R2HL96_9SPHI|nr:hypothetical protein [Pedobacter psychrotolerans]TCO30788.1 hypothetical protein EV200_101227 [Pedobacter psychrotolerans]GGE44421.1 hypothetical protein GCM10011413_08180 [Pedobacter psychrotolerans]
MINQVTLQINISPGDINYAGLTIPALVANHSDIKKRLLIVDCCRPQKTKLVDPDLKFPIHNFEKNVEKIIEISKKLLKDNIVTEVHYLYHDSPLFKVVSKKYLNNLYDCTHAAGGTANMSYWVGIELCNSKYVLHYDGDIILYQKSDYSWVEEALSLMLKEENVIIAVPRLAPPPNEIDYPSYQEGREITSFEKFWINDWFSTRHFLLDKEKLNSFLPLVIGKVKVELLLRKYLRRAFPIDPEMLLFKSLGRRGCKRLILKNKNAWITHPADKPENFLRNVKKIISEVKQGNFPLEQMGYENINLDAWINFIENKESD